MRDFLGTVLMLLFFAVGIVVVPLIFVGGLIAQLFVPRRKRRGD